jgi:hypothetical protein
VSRVGSIDRGTSGNYLEGDGLGRSGVVVDGGIGGRVDDAYHAVLTVLAG